MPKNKPQENDVLKGKRRRVILMIRKEERIALLDEILAEGAEIFPAWLDDVEEPGMEVPEDSALAADQAMKRVKEKVIALITKKRNEL